MSGGEIRREGCLMSFAAMKWRSRLPRCIRRLVKRGAFWMYNHGLIKVSKLMLIFALYDLESL